MKKDQKNKKEQQDEFTDEQRNAILQKEFNVGKNKDGGEKKTLEGIIDSVIDAIKDNGDIKDRIKKYWFTKQIEEWKEKKKEEKNNADKEPSDDKLMDIVKKDLKIRIANTILELIKQQDIDEKNIWFYQAGRNVSLQHNGDKICEVLSFNYFNQLISPPYKPFFINNQNDNNKLNGVCIYKYGDDQSKTKWITAYFKNDETEPKCKITFRTDENDKIKNVEIKLCKNIYSETTYTISLNDKGEVKKNQDENYYDYEIKKQTKKLLFEDDTIKVLREMIENELNSEQKKVFDNIKKYLCLEKDTKEEKKEDSTNIITQDINNINKKGENENNASCNCCGLDLSCLDYCGLCK